MTEITTSYHPIHRGPENPIPPKGTSAEKGKKTGHWIVRDLPHKELLYNRTVLVCSECNFGMSQSLLGFTDYCPNCGARMSEVEE